eukprot:15814957-Heterocapsa_arctica.AAC.1
MASLLCIWARAGSATYSVCSSTPRPGLSLRDSRLAQEFACWLGPSSEGPGCCGWLALLGPARCALDADLRGDACAEKRSQL